MVANNLPSVNPDPGVSLNSTFSVLSHVAYQIKWNRECSNMQAHILPSTTGVGSNVKIFFLKVVILHIKLNGIEHRAPRKHIFCPYYKHPQYMGSIKR